MGWVRTAAALCALIVVVIPAPAAGKAPRSFYGVVSQGRLDRSDFDRMSSGKVGTLRVPLAWAQINRTAIPADYDWSAFDSTVAEAARHRIAVLPIVYTVPVWVSVIEGCDQPVSDACAISPPRTTLGLSAWRSFLGAAVGRYGPGGRFWTLHPDLPETPIHAWQIWNEQNDPGFFQPHPDVDRYAELVTAASEAIHGRDAEAEIVLGGMTRYPLHGHEGGVRATGFLRDLYSHPGIEAAFEGVALHPYAGGLPGVKRQVRHAARIVRELDPGRPSIWISEVGWASSGEPMPLNPGRQGQARRLTEAFRYFTRVRQRLGISAVLWYAWRDVSATDAYCTWCARAGLFPVRSLDHPKPAWASFLNFTGGS